MCRPVGSLTSVPASGGARPTRGELVAAVAPAVGGTASLASAAEVNWWASGRGMDDGVENAGGWMGRRSGVDLTRPREHLPRSWSSSRSRTDFPFLAPERSIPPLLSCRISRTSPACLQVGFVKSAARNSPATTGGVGARR